MSTFLETSDCILQGTCSETSHENNVTIIIVDVDNKLFIAVDNNSCVV